MKATGLVLVLLGIIGILWGGFTYTTRKQVVDVGPVHVSQDQKHDVPVPPIAGALALVGGIAVLAASKGR